MTRILTLIFFIFIPTSAVGQKSLRIVFWNVENLFDTRDNPQTKDDDFLPDAPRHWSFYRYKQKLQSFCKTVVATGDGKVPDLLGICEIEGDSVIHDLYHLTPFYRLGYRQIITHSPDERGINVAFFYKRNHFKVISTQSHRVKMPTDFKPTRDILRILGLTTSFDTLDLFVCHLPSRRGGESVTHKARKIAYQELTFLTDSIYQVRSNPNIIVMGDFNDSPCSALQSELGLCEPILSKETFDFYKKEVPRSLFPSNKQKKQIHSYRFNARQKGKTSTNLYNLMSLIPSYLGSYKYQGSWESLDQFLVSKNLINKDSVPAVTQFDIFSLPFLLTEDEKFGGKRPRRTYYGYRYEGGSSDHLPIYLDLKVE